MNLKRLQKRINDCYKVDSKFKAIQIIKTTITKDTNNNLNLLTAKKLVDDNWFKTGRVSPGSKIVKELERLGYLENNNIK